MHVNKHRYNIVQTYIYIYQIFLQFNIIQFEFHRSLATRYQLLNGITLKWNNIFHIRLHAICSA